MQKSDRRELERGQKRGETVVSWPRIHTAIPVPLEALHRAFDTSQTVRRLPPCVIEAGFLPSARRLLRRLPLRVAGQQWRSVDSLLRGNNLYRQDPSRSELHLPPA